MPNQPKTPARSVRVPDDLWQTAKAMAEARGETVSEVIVRVLKRSHMDRVWERGGRRLYFDVDDSGMVEIRYDVFEKLLSDAGFKWIPDDQYNDREITASSASDF